MPNTKLIVGRDGICRVNERTDNSETIGNFTLDLVASVDGDKDAVAGGPGFLVHIQRFPDEVER